MEFSLAAELNQPRSLPEEDFQEEYPKIPIPRQAVAQGCHYPWCGCTKSWILGDPSVEPGDFSVLIDWEGFNQPQEGPLHQGDVHWNVPWVSMVMDRGWNSAQLRLWRVFHPFP